MLAIPLAHLAAGDGVAPEARSADEVRQASKLASKAYATKIVGWDKIFERDLARRVRRFGEHVHAPVLCVGARLGAEVRAFRQFAPGTLAIGTDFAPGERNPWVLWGDAHKLEFEAGSFGTVYTNVLDHIRDPAQFAREAHRVLWPQGTLWIDMDQHAADKFANHDLRRQRHQILANITAARFEVVMEAVLLKSCDDAYKRGMAKPGRGRVGDWKSFGPDATLNCIELEEKDTHPYGKFVYILERRGGGPGGNHTGARRRHHVARPD